MNTHLIILGAPGSGKGTQAANLVKALGYNHVSTGDLLRLEVAKGSELGKKVSNIMSSGNLVDDQTVLDLLKANCKVDTSAYIFDGFPRNVNQAEMLNEQLLSKTSTKVIYFDIDLNILAERIVNRRVCDKCGEIYNLISKKPRNNDECDKCGAIASLKQRKDDTPEVVENRLKVFNDSTSPLLSYYDKKGVLVKINALQAEEKVFEELTKIITH